MMQTMPEQHPAAHLKRAEHGVKAAFFALFRVFLKRGQPDQTPLDGTQVKRVLLLRPETKLGDMVISLPVIDTLKRHYPHIKISILCSPGNVGLIKDDPRFEMIFLYRKNIFRDIAEVRRIRREQFDCVLDLLCDDSVTSLVLSQYCTPRKPRIGVGKQQFADYYDFNRFNGVDESRHIVNNTLHLLDAFGVDTGNESGHAAVYLSENDRDIADRFVASVNDGRSQGPLLGFNVSAGTATRRWAEQKQAELIEKILGHDSSARFVIVCTPADRDQGQRLCDQIPEKLHLVPDRLSITAASAIIKRLDLLISPDTSLVHIARSFRVPVVSMYPGVRKNLTLWRPFGQDDGFVVAKHPDNIFDITVEQVFDAYLQLMASQKKVEN